MSPAKDTGAPARSEPAIWQEVEFGSYDADLPLWDELAETVRGAVLELGAGAGRVTIHLAEGGHRVIAIEHDPALGEELKHETQHLDVTPTVVTADLASPPDLHLPSRPALAIGPLHVIQVLDGAGRVALLARLRELVAPGGTLALTVVDESTLLSAGAASSITGRHKDRGRIYPDIRELDGWVYSSEPLWVQVGDETLTVRRLRERVSPEGRMERAVHDELLYRVSPERLRLEAEDAGLTGAGTRKISSGANEADSTVVLLEVPG
jgi:precorrin-6B methylase 2